MKTPIQPILGLCELLRERNTTIEKEKEILDIIFRNSKTTNETCRRCIKCCKN